MKTITKFSAYINGSQSKLNVHFSDGSQFARTIEAHEAIKLSGNREYLSELMEKYAEPQQYTAPQKLYIGTRRKGGF